MPRGQSTIERMNATSRIGTYNIHGKLERDMREHEYTLQHDMKRLKIQVCCFQETKMSENYDEIIKGYGRVINIAGRSITRAQNWGLGFYIEEQWAKAQRRVHFEDERQR